MDQEHKDLPTYEVIAIAENIVAVKIKPEVFITQEKFEVPVPKQLDAENVEPPAKKPKSDLENIMSHKDFIKASKEGKIYIPTYGKNPFQPHPQAAAIRYRYSAIKEEEQDVITVDPEEEDEF